MPKAIDPREQLTGRFLRDLRDVYLDEGEGCLRALAQMAPDKFLALVARLVPTQVEAQVETSVQSYQSALEQLAHRRLSAVAEERALTQPERDLLS